MTTKEKRAAFVKYFVAWGAVSPFFFLLLPRNGPYDALDYFIYLIMLISCYLSSMVVKTVALLTKSGLVHFAVFSIAQLSIYLLSGLIISKLIFKENMIQKPSHEKNQKDEKIIIFNRKDN